MRILFEEILASGVSMCFHNGLIDLMFIYQHFYHDLPETSAELLANISDWFQSMDEENGASIFDSKYIAEYSERTKASFLEYLFRKYQRQNWEELSCDRVYLDLRFPTTSQQSSDVEWVDCRLPKHVIDRKYPQSISGEELCLSYAVSLLFDML